MARQKKNSDGAHDGASDAENDLARAREEFAATLDEIEQRLNPKVQFARARAAVTKRVARITSRDPRR